MTIVSIAFAATVSAATLLDAVASPAWAQTEPAQDRAAIVDGFPDVRLVVAKKTQRPLVGDSFQTQAGELILDAAGRVVRFEADGRVLLSVSYDRLTAAHFETTKYPRRVFWQVNRFLVISYAGNGGQPESSILQLTKANEGGVLAALGHNTGLRVEQRPSTSSLAGLPIHLSVGDSVHVVRDSGPEIEDTVTAVSSTGVRLASTSPIDMSDIQKIQVRDSIWNGALLGGIVSIVPAALVTGSACFESCSTVAGLTASGWGVIALGFVAGAGIDASIMRVAFRRTGQAAARHIVVAPTATATERSVRVFVGF